jgi:DNA-binding response OmpR family regulator
MARKILIIDDDSEYVEAITGLLKEKGFETKSCADGNAGLAAVKASAPDAIILDIMMTYDSEGLDMATKLAEDPASQAIPIIMVTGIRRPEDLPQGGTVRAMLEKPVKPDALLAAIESCFA